MKKKKKNILRIVFCTLPRSNICVTALYSRKTAVKMARVFPVLIGSALDQGVVIWSVRMSRAVGVLSFADAMMLLSKFGVNEEDIVTLRLHI